MARLAPAHTPGTLIGGIRMKQIVYCKAGI